MGGLEIQYQDLVYMCGQSGVRGPSVGGDNAEKLERGGEKENVWMPAILSRKYQKKSADLCSAMQYSANPLLMRTSHHVRLAPLIPLVNGVIGVIGQVMQCNVQMRMVLLL